MKVGILTYYGVHNHGAVLQANALNTIIKSLGYECGFLKFERDYSLIPQKQVNKYKLNLKSILFYIRYLQEKGIGNILYNFTKSRVLKKYRIQNLPLKEDYYQFSGDIVVIGSDEVFSLEIGINPFLYGNIPNAKRIISYAGSFGPTNVKDIKSLHLEQMIKSGFEKMEAIGVRDENSKNVIHEIAGCSSILVCDPVILYGYEKEMLLFKPSVKRYILVYSYDRSMNNPKETEEVIKYAKKRDLKVYSVGYYHEWCKSIQATPEELLGWIKNAELVITDTFHGAVMSIICNTAMVVKLRGNKNKLEFLLGQYGLSDRIITQFKEIENIAERPIDFECVNNYIKKYRKESINFLKNALKGKKC